MKALRSLLQCQKGFTLLELMFLCMLLPMLGMALFGMLSGSQSIFQQTDVYSTQNDAAAQMLRTIGREIAQTSSLISPSRLTISNTGLSGSSIVTFQIPVDFDNDGDVVTSSANPAVEWGGYTEIGQTTSGTLGGYTRYLLVASANASEGNRLVRRELDAAQATVSEKILMPNVLTFSVTQSQSMLTLNVSVQKTEPIKNRTYTASFSHRVLTQNNVS